MPHAKATENSYMFENGPCPVAIVRKTRLAPRRMKPSQPRIVAYRPIDAVRGPETKPTRPVVIGTPAAAIRAARTPETA